MGKSSARVLFAVGAFGAIIAGYLLRSPGAWGIGASWGLLAASGWFWNQASGIDEQIKDASERASQAYVSGLPDLDRSGTRGVKKGLAWTMAALLFAFLGAMGLLGTFSAGLAWGVIGVAPVAALGWKLYAELQSHVENE